MLSQSHHFSRKLLLVLISFWASATLVVQGAKRGRCTGTQSPRYLGCYAEWVLIIPLWNYEAIPNELTHTFEVGMLATAEFMGSQGLDSGQYQLAFQTLGESPPKWTVATNLRRTIGCTANAAIGKYRELYAKSRRRGNAPDISSAFNTYGEFTKRLVLRPGRKYKLLQARVFCRNANAKFYTKDVRLQDTGSANR